jgi:hypothetical protein
MEQVTVVLAYLVQEQTKMVALVGQPLLQALVVVVVAQLPAIMSHTLNQVLV